MFMIALTIADFNLINLKAVPTLMIKEEIGNVHIFQF